MSTPDNPMQTMPIQPQQPAHSSGLGVASLVLGILALLGAAIPFLNIGGIILGVLAIILGLIAITRRAGRGLGVGGVILGILGIIISIIVMAVAATALQAVDDALNAEHKIEYTATVDTGEGKVSWGTSGTSNESFTGTWTKTETVNGTSIATLSLTGDFTTTQKFTCEIKVDDKIVDSQSGETYVNCTVVI